MARRVRATLSWQVLEEIARTRPAMTGMERLRQRGFLITRRTREGHGASCYIEDNAGSASSA